MDVQESSSDAPVASIASALRGDGAAVVHSLAPAETADAVASNLRAYFDAEGTYAQCDFNGYKTLRLSAILARSRASANLIGHERVLGVLDEILLAHCINYRIGSTTAIEILPGEGDQTLHRDDSIYPARMPGMEWQVSVMWALTDFTAENGATRVVLGSHREWMREGGRPTDEIQKAMHRGSAIRATAPSSASIPTRRTAVGFSRTSLTNLKPNIRCVAIRLTADEIGVPYVIESGI